MPSCNVNGYLANIFLCAECSRDKVAWQLNVERSCDARLAHLATQEVSINYSLFITRLASIL